MALLGFKYRWEDIHGIRSNQTEEKESKGMTEEDSLAVLLIDLGRSAQLFTRTTTPEIPLSMPMYHNKLDVALDRLHDSALQYAKAHLRREGYTIVKVIK